MPPLVPLADALAFVGVTAGSPDEANVSRLLDAISGRIRQIGRRAFEGAATVYDLEIHVRGVQVFTLPHVPVDALLALRTVAFDGTEEGLDTPRDVVGGASTTVAADAANKATNVKVASVVSIAPGDHVRIGAGTAQEVVRVSVVGTAGAAGTGLTVEPALRYAHATAQAVVEVAGSEGWRLEDAARGLVRRRTRSDYLRATWRVTGALPDPVEQGTLEWLKDRWDSRTVQGALKRYRTGDDEEEYFESLAGVPPREVMLAVLGSRHTTGGGPV